METRKDDKTITADRSKKMTDNLRKTNSLDKIPKRILEND
jgi:hypothetical protein